ncbi:MAG: hypothetical protein ACOCSI_02020, partial [Desulfohalobiaceae bacterium]
QKVKAAVGKDELLTLQQARSGLEEVLQIHNLVFGEHNILVPRLKSLIPEYDNFSIEFCLGFGFSNLGFLFWDNETLYMLNLPLLKAELLGQSTSPPA